MSAFTLRPRGGFSLAAAARFAEGFPGTDADRPDGELRFAWAVDNDWRTARVRLRERRGAVHGELDGDPPADLAKRARCDVERILSLDVDGSGFAAVGERDPVVGALQRRFDGLRPVLFYTPYEAAAWTLIGQRIHTKQAAAVKRRLTDEFGEHGAFPAPERLATLVAPQRGLTETKIGRLRELGRAAADGLLGRDRLRGMPLDEALEDLRQLRGVGPFAAELVMIRGVGAPDALPRHEKRLAGVIRTAYHMTEDGDVAPIAERWKPYRAWASLLLRADLEAGSGQHGHAARA